MNHPRAAQRHDAALLLARLALGSILVGHGCRTLAVDGIGRTTPGFEHLSIPVAILAAVVLTVVDVLGGALVVAGLATTPVAVVGVLTAVARAGQGIEDGSRPAVAAGLVVLAVAGPGRWSAEHLLRVRRSRPTPAGRTSGVDGAAVPPAGLPLLPVIRLEPEERALVGARSQGPVLPPAGTGPGPVPLRHH